MLPKQAIEEFRQIFLREEGILLSDQEAVALGNNLINLFRVLTKTASKFEQSLVSRIDKTK